MSVQHGLISKRDISTQVLEVIDKYQTIARNQPSGSGLYLMYFDEIEKSGLRKFNPALFAAMEGYKESDEFKRGGYITSTVLVDELERQKQLILRNNRPSGD